MTDYLSFNAAENLDAAEIDRINAEFYGRFNYPWRAPSLTQYRDPAFAPRFLCQEAGDFDGRAVPPDGDIWVAGCGTNQAVITALRFPGARVLGTDLSERSLAVAEASARDLALTNLRLEQASLNAPHHVAAFDHIICTGVIHHNADPARPLAHLARALKPGGVMELMVYNYYHRIQTTAFQKAIRLLSGTHGRGGLVEAELPMALEMVADFALPGSMADFLARQRGLPEPAVADSLLQPVEFSYTVETLAALCRGAGLVLLHPCLNQFDKISGDFSWEPPLYGTAATAFGRLDDLARWQVANLLMQERAPMLWFYLGHGPARRSRDEVNADFLGRRFRPAQCDTQIHVLGADDRYTSSPRRTRLPAPAVPADPQVRAVFQACDGSRSMAEVLSHLGPLPGEAEITRLRQLLTTPAFPYLLAS
ncbi:MAG: class I SAM-dependent methyltransferase [Rhodobacteraceae bacterium]|nr:class I SAM-dependent methyltransferase [Paracoccaceae bacterium]